MTSRFLLTALISTPLLVALEPRADDVSFRPENGSSLTKEYTIDLNIALGDITAYFDGQDLSESVPADFELLAELALSVTDEYVRTVEGIPHELIRTFDSMELYWEAADESGEAEDFGELEGKSVKFEWNEEDENYDVSYHESDGDEELLQGLGPDMDLRVLLPDGDVSEGDTWSIEADDLASVFFFGTNFEDMEMGDGENAAPRVGKRRHWQLIALVRDLEGQAACPAFRSLWPCRKQRLAKLDDLSSVQKNQKTNHAFGPCARTPRPPERTADH